GGGSSCGLRCPFLYRRSGDGYNREDEAGPCATGPGLARRSRTMTSSGIARRTATAALTALAACAHGPAPRPAPVVPVAAGAVATDDDYQRLRADFEGLRIGAPERAARRGVLEAWLLDEVQREGASERHDQALQALSRALSLWDADELKPGIRDEG